jgi:exodeoxyribonuclease VII large subunit
MHTISTHAVTVSEYASKLGHALRAVGPAAIEGEVQKPKSSGSGMLWFSLTDGEAVLSCKVFGRQVGGLERTPREGDLVEVDVERPDLWSQAGKLDLIVSQIRLAGEGELLLRRQALVVRLAAEGFCDPARRRPLPRIPRAVGVIAGAGSDGMSDVIRALTDRWPTVHVVTCASVVQGKAAPRQLIDALACLQEHPLVDVIIVARGGGSVQDLACFDDEGLCRALFACAVPVVCAIGHTDNNPVCNHVAWPAFTPSRSAELVVPSAADVRRDLATARERLDAVPGRVALARERLHATALRLRGAAALDARAALVRERAREVHGALAELVTEYERGLERVRGLLAAVPHRAARELAARREGIPGLVAAVASAGDLLLSLGHDVRDQAARVRTGTRRQLDDHRRDFGRALARLLRELRGGIDRRAADVGEDINRQGERLGECAHRRLTDARRDTLHAAALIAANDFRRRGWLLASAAGVPLRSTADLRAGQRVDLQLHDGRAEAVVENVNPEPGAELHEQNERAHL